MNRRAFFASICLPLLLPLSATRTSRIVDDEPGTVKTWIGPIMMIPFGWALMDGHSNAPANGGTGWTLPSWRMTGNRVAHSIEKLSHLDNRAVFR